MNYVDSNCQCDVHIRFWKTVANWVTNHVNAVCNEQGISIEEFSKRVPPENLRQLVLLMMERKDRIHVACGLDLTEEDFARLDRQLRWYEDN